jgi:hypothetical protein
MNFPPLYKWENKCHSQRGDRRLIAQVRNSKMPYTWLENELRGHETKNGSSRITFSLSLSRRKIEPAILR